MSAKTAQKDKTASYKQSFDSAIEELAELMAEREEVETRREQIERRVNLLREAILGFAWLCGKSSYEVAKERPELFPDTASPDVGFTDAIRSVFRDDRDSSHSAIGIRDYLDFTGFDIAKYKNVLASIHSILKRLKNKGEIIEATRDGKVVYKCNPRGPLATDPEPKAEPELSDDDIPF
jgi:hypothetical protein